MTSDRNRPGFGPGFWAGLALAMPDYPGAGPEPCAEETSPAHERLALARARRRERVQQPWTLVQLDEHVLRDIGVSGRGTRAGAHKPSWRA